MAAATHPFASWRDQGLTAEPRYAEILDRFGPGLALQQVICGCHVHVAIPDLDTGIAVMDRARPYLAVLLAMTGSSAFHEGVDTGYASYRTEWLSRWPTAGPNEVLGDEAGYRAVVAGLRAAGVIDDPSHVYWDIRPSMHYPTIEFRVGDVCTDIDDALLHATLVRSLCRVLASRVEYDAPWQPIRPELLRAARWRAARYGLTDRLLDPDCGALVPARTAVADLLAELRDDLEEHAEWDEVEDLSERLLQRGTSAERQRPWLHDGASHEEIAARLVRWTNGDPV
jgi:carboxylate-amine ligase